MRTLQIDNLNLDIHNGPIGIFHSGGCDSGILLYLLMSNTPGPINVFTCASKEKGRVAAKIAEDVIAKCIDLTNNNNVFHHVFYVDSQTKENLFDIPNSWIRNLKIVYTGATGFPPDDVLQNFNNKSDLYHIRDPNKTRPLYMNRVYMPFWNYNKQDIFNIYKHFDLLDTLFPVTRSCEDLELREGHCGKCWWCEERLWAFNKLT